MYDNYSLTLDEWEQRAAIEQSLKEEAKMVQRATSKPITAEEKEKFEQEK